MPGENIDLTSDPHPPQPEKRSGGRRFIGVQFDCCDTYSRIYINREETAYMGNCPRCAKPIQVQIGYGGTSVRFFRVT